MRWSIFFILLFLLPLTSAWFNNSFSYGDTYGLFNLTGNLNLTKFVIIPQNLYILNASFKLNSSIYKDCYQESANESSSCGGLATGTYSFSNELNDGNYTTFYNTAGVYYVNFTKPSNVFPTSKFSSWKTYTGACGPVINQTNITIPTVCWNINPTLIQFNYNITSWSEDMGKYTITHNIKTLGCFNGLDWTELENLNYDTRSDFVYTQGCYINYLRFSDDGMYWSKGATDNLSISVNNNQVFNNTYFNITNSTTDFYKILNTYIQTHQANNGFYTIPIDFSSNAQGILEYYNLNFIGDPVPNITLISPPNNYVTSLLNASGLFANDLTPLKNTTLFVWNQTGIINQTTIDITGFINTTSTIVNLSSGTYWWNYLACNLQNYCYYAPSNYTIIVDNVNPILNLFPSNGFIFNRNISAINISITGANVDSLFLYGNWTGQYKLNFTLKASTNGLYNFSFYVPDGNYLWTASVNKTTGAVTYAQQGNFTFAVDTTPPSITINSITTTQGSLIFTASNTISDLHGLSVCKYTILNSNNLTDGTSLNQTFTCGNNIIGSTTGYGNFNLLVYSNDTLGNERYTQAPFTISPIPVNPPAGGGGAYIPPVQITNTTIEPNLEDNLFGALSESAIVYEGINITWFTLGALVIVIFIIIYSVKHKKVKIAR